MKKILYSLSLICLICAGMQAQDNANVSLLLGKAALGKGISTQFQSRLENQLLGVFTSGGEAVGGNYSAFAVRPSLEIVERGKIEGMKAMPTVKLSLVLKLQNVLTDAVLDVREVMLTGSGSTDDEAIGKAIGGIRKTQPQLSKAQKDFQSAIRDYYGKNCGQLMAEANEFAERKQYREAFSVLQSVPPGTACFDEVRESRAAFYQQQQASECASTLAGARAANAANNFSLALELLSQVGGDSPCFGEAKTLVAETESKVDAELKNQYDWMFKFHSTGAEAETARWNAMNSLFLGWLRESRHFDLIKE